MAGLVQRAAAALGWPEELKWCFHAARHGGDQETARGLETASANDGPHDHTFGDAIAAVVKTEKQHLLNEALQQFLDRESVCCFAHNVVKANAFLADNVWMHREGKLFSRTTLKES